MVGVALALLLWFFLDEILVWIGSSAETLRPARTYLAIVLTSAPFILIGNCFSNVLRAEGQSTSAMMGMLVGNLLNVILDPLMIITFGWGIAGAAIATVIGNVVGAGYYLGYFLKGKSTLSISVKDFTIKEHTLSDVLSIGIPASLGSLLMSVSSIILNSRMASYGDMLRRNRKMNSAASRTPSMALLYTSLKVELIIVVWSCSMLTFTPSGSDLLMLESSFFTSFATVALLESLSLESINMVII